MTFERLVSEGFSQEEAWRWLSAVVLQEMSLIVRDNRPFDRAGYVAALNCLPTLIDR